MTHSEQVSELFKALAVASGELKSLPKNCVNPYFNSKYADLAITQEMSRGILSKNGLVLIQSVETDGNDHFVESLLAHSSGQWIKSKIKLLLNKQDMQGLGSATTYAKRYAAQSILGLCGDEDDDGNAASKQQQQKEADFDLPPGKYKIKFGQYKDQLIESVDPSKLYDYCAWIESEAVRQEKKIEGLVEEFLFFAREFLKEKT